MPTTSLLKRKHNSFCKIPTDITDEFTIYNAGCDCILHLSVEGANSYKLYTHGSWRVSKEGADANGEHLINLKRGEKIKLAISLIEINSNETNNPNCHIYFKHLQYLEELDDLEKHPKLYLAGTINSLIKGFDHINQSADFTDLSLYSSDTGLFYNFLNSLGIYEWHDGYIYAPPNSCVYEIKYLGFPPMILSKNCFSNMFSECNITELPNLQYINTLADNCYESMFSGCHMLNNIQGFSLPATTLAPYCYKSMFEGCHALANIQGFLLPATTLAPYCYAGMFINCTTLANAGFTISATALAEYCYAGMFSGCECLSVPPVIKANTLAQHCCESMFEKCLALKTAPTLHATALAEYCYKSMFEGCSALVNAPKLLATTLKNGCYESMFSDCKNLEIAPDLKAANLKTDCYRYMFYECSKLKSIKMLANNIPTSEVDCLTNWVQGVSPSGTFTKYTDNNSLSRGNSGIPLNWNLLNQSSRS